ncbi:hypothetical protein D9M71_481770 [compost metagenome]
MQANLLALASNLAAVPIVAEYDQHRIADGLAGQAGAGGTKRHGDLFAVRQLEQGHHFSFGFDADHQLGDQPIEAGIGTEGQGRGRIIEAALAWNQTFGFLQKTGRQAHWSSRINTTRSFGPWAPYANTCSMSAVFEGPEISKALVGMPSAHLCRCWT